MFRDTWTFDGNANYNTATGTATVTIGKATLPVLVTSDLMLANQSGDDHDDGTHRSPPPLDHVPGMRLLAYTLMPSHWHLVLWPRRDGALSDFGQLRAANLGEPVCGDRRP